MDDEYFRTISLQSIKYNRRNLFWWFKWIHQRQQEGYREKNKIFQKYEAINKIYQLNRDGVKFIIYNSKLIFNESTLILQNLQVYNNFKIKF